MESATTECLVLDESDKKVGERDRLFRRYLFEGTGNVDSLGMVVCL